MYRQRALSNLEVHAFVVSRTADIFIGMIQVLGV